MMTYRTVSGIAITMIWWASTVVGVPFSDIYRKMMTQLPGSNRLPGVVEPLSLQNLIDGIERHDFEQIYFGDNRVITRSKDEDFTYITPINPYITTKLVDISLKNQLDPIFVPSTAPESPPDLVGGFINVFILFSILRSVQMYASRWLSRRNSDRNQTETYDPFMGMGMGMGGFGFMPPGANSRNREYTVNTTLADWAGSREVLVECAEIVTYLTNNTNYINAGASIPKGILMEGPPGTGKTLLAKAIAGEADASFIAMAGSEFIEMYVGLGAQRVRNLFDEARRKSPCIIFIDEIDAIGRQRGGGGNMNMGSNEEKDQTLNQLLSEMDGFNNNDGIMVLAATNRRDILDKALLRPGRFDRVIQIPLPDTSSRQNILELYLKNKVKGQEIDTLELAKITRGFSGAQLKNLLNEAAILVARRNDTTIGMPDIREALEKTLIGIKKTVDDRPADIKRRVAIHEVGHAFIVAKYPQYFDLQKVSIQASYSGVGGFTLFTEKDGFTEGGLYTKDFLVKRLMVAMGGKAAEAVFYGEDFVSVGATGDLNQANMLASDMIEKYGMGDKLNVFFKSPQSEPFTKYAEATKATIDREVTQLVKEAYHMAMELIRKNRDILDILVDDLLAKTQVTNELYLPMVAEVAKAECETGCEL